MNQKAFYNSGEEVKLGDSVILGDSSGKIVFIVSTNQYSEKYTKDDWQYLKSGFGIETEKYGLIHQDETDEDLILLKRKK